MMEFPEFWVTLGYLGLRSPSAVKDSPGPAATALKITAGWGISRTHSKIQHLFISGK